MKFKLGTFGTHGLYIYDLYNTSSDAALSKLIGMEKEEFQDYLRKNYDAVTCMDEHVFNDRKNAEKALEWFESRVLAYKMIRGE